MSGLSTVNMKKESAASQQDRNKEVRPPEHLGFHRKRPSCKRKYQICMLLSTMLNGEFPISEPKNLSFPTLKQVTFHLSQTRGEDEKPAFGGGGCPDEYFSTCGNQSTYGLERVTFMSLLANKTPFSSCLAFFMFILSQGIPFLFLLFFFFFLSPTPIDNQNAGP